MSGCSISPPWPNGSRPLRIAFPGPFSYIGSFTILTFWADVVARSFYIREFLPLHQPGFLTILILTFNGTYLLCVYNFNGPSPWDNILQVILERIINPIFSPCYATRPFCHICPLVSQLAP